MVRRILVLSIGVAAFIFVALLPMASWAGGGGGTLGIITAGEPTHFYIVRGADSVIYYTLEQLDTSPEIAAGTAFPPSTICAANPFQLATDMAGALVASAPSGRTLLSLVPFRHPFCAVVGVVVSTLVVDNQSSCDGVVRGTGFTSPPSGTAGLPTTIGHREALTIASGGSDDVFMRVATLVNVLLLS